MTCVKAFSISADQDTAKWVTVPTHHQRIGRDRTSLPNVNAFFWYPKRVRKYLSRDLYREDAFQSQYVVFYTHDRGVYERQSKAIEDRTMERWYGEMLIFRKGRGGGDVVSLNKRRGDTDTVLWRVVERWAALQNSFRFIRHAYTLKGS